MFAELKYFFLWLVTPVQKYLQRSGKQEPLVTAEQVERAVELIKDGDIVLSYETGRPTSILIDGYYDHAAIITSKKTVMESVGDRFINGKNTGGVRQVNLVSWLTKKDSFCVIRPVYDKNKTRANINKLASETVFSFEGLAYDYQFKRGNETVYCSELVYISYLRHDKRFLYHIPKNTEILPMDYYALCLDSRRADMFFQIVYEARNK